MVPMPPPSATGATNAGGDGGIVVAPAGPPFGPLVAPLPVEPAQPVPAATMQAPAQASAAAPAAAGETSRPPAYPSAPPPQRGSGTPSTGPTAAQLAAIEDPEIRLEAARDAAERMEREARMQANAAPALPLAGGSAPAAAPAQQAVAGVAGGDVQVARNAPASPSVSPAVRAGYATFGAGDLAAARRHYAAALRDDPNSRDALLGSAAVALRERRDDEAAGYYARLLAIDPRNAQAIAGLAALRPDDSERTEVRLKGVLRGTPDAAPIHFALGNLYARQGRWQDAQAAYFHAWSAAPANADYAFNLAVGLDRLNQGRLAREYYQRALALSAGGAASFDRAAAQRRLEELAPVAAPGVPAAGAAAPVPAVNPAAGN
jgi:tetratricopeptide (TPR) repeat protein